ncbi:MAG: aminotransferase class III-fold pyridoxal phosphate-dependent enzyme, partial [Actinomycetota bacterium]
KLLAEEHEGIEADVTLIGKALSGGFYPVSAVLSNSEVLGVLKPGQHGSTFGGTPLACAIAHAELRVLVEEDMIGNAERQGEKLRAFFTGMQAQYPCIGEVRGKGLMDAIECVMPGTKEPNAAVAKAFIAECSKQKLILMGAGSFGNCVRFLPPLNLSDEDLDVAFGIFTDAAKVAFA